MAKMRKETCKFWLIYNAIIFAVYFLISTIVLFLYTGNATWTLSLQTVPIWVLAFLLSFSITCAIRKRLGLGIFAVAIVVAIAFIIHFIYQMNELNDLNTQHLSIFPQILIPSYVVFIMHAVGQGVYEKWFKK